MCQCDPSLQYNTEKKKKKKKCSVSEYPDRVCIMERNQIILEIV